MPTETQHESKTKLLEAAWRAIRTEGYAATTVEDICRQAGITKGSFFHHFKTKDDLALAAIAHWESMTGEFFAKAPYHTHPDPLDRLLGYVEFRASILSGELSDYTCLLGTLVQETYASHPQLREACDRGMASHIGALIGDIEAAKQRYAPHASWTAQSVGYFIQSVLQGSFIYAKAKQDAATVRDSLEHLRRYLNFTFNRTPPIQ
jgi:TetR/AcrR family transcriptional regulator, transcriptional repressor for nem operon